MEEKPIPSKYNPWSLVYYTYDPEREKSRDTLLTIGNGYLGSRGAPEESAPGDIHYPGTYIAGLYNRLVSQVEGKEVENEDFVNCPNWHHVTFRIDNGDWFNMHQTTLIASTRVLDFKSGILKKEWMVKDRNNRRFKIISRRFASMANPHLVALQYQLVPLNFSGWIEMKSVTDGKIRNQGVPRYNDLNQHHLMPVAEGNNERITWLSVKTTQSEIEVTQAARFTVFKNKKPEAVSLIHTSQPGMIHTAFRIHLNEKEELCLEKTVAFFTSKKDDVDNPLERSIDLVQHAGSFAEIREASALAWKKIWEKTDVEIQGDSKSQMLIRLHLYHLMVTVSPHNKHIDAGIPARGLHGEAYRGHIFWDELYIMPWYCLYFPEVAKSVLLYRYRRLDKARTYAREHGYQGAMFPWQSGSSGREETQVIHLNPISGEWGEDYSSLQRHISLAVAYNTWYYFHITEDLDFMENYGAEMFFEICRFWASKTSQDQTSGSYSIQNVMGPDEFHETHEASPGGGLKNNAYTNIMVSWLFRKALEVLGSLPESYKKRITSKINLTDSETAKWLDISRKLKIRVSKEGIIEQFEGYFNLKELDWNAYRQNNGNISRLDRILKAEGKSPDDYKLAKQADTLMVFYILDREVVTQILKDCGHTLPENYLERNYNYYINRTSHGSTLSRVVHSYLANLYNNKKLVNKLYFEALQSDFTDIQGGTTAEGIHAGVMGGTVFMVLKSFAGINFKKEIVEIHPKLPDQWKSIQCNFGFKNNHYFLHLTHNQLKIKIYSENSDQIGLLFVNKKIILPANKEISLNY
jgi:trehalose/maltose hydrolase-like predicted phosphorylase